MSALARWMAAHLSREQIQRIRRVAMLIFAVCVVAFVWVAAR